MKLEYLAAGSVDCPLVRLFSFTPAEAEALRRVFVELAIGTRISVSLHALPFVEPVNGCRLTLRAAARDEGLTNVDGEPAAFECALTPATWDNVAGLCEPFTQGGTRGFQWLDRTDVPLLFSSDGSW